MSIETLIRLIPPPADPVEPFRGPWDQIEAELGTQLPDDYKGFCRAYGVGGLMGFLAIYVPRATSRWARLESQVRVIHPWVVDQLRPSLGDEPLPHSFWPEPAGLIVCGHTHSSDTIYWQPRGQSPKDWGIVVAAKGFWRFETFDGSLTTFLARVAAREIQPIEFPNLDDGAELKFEPASGSSPPRDDREHPEEGRSFQLKAAFHWTGWRPN